MKPDLSEAIALAGLLRQAGMDFLDITMGNPYVNPHVNRPFAKGGYEPDEEPIEGVARMLRGTAEIAAAHPGLPVICSGLSYLGAASANVAAACVAEGWFAMAGYGRETLAYPNLARDVCHGEWNAASQCLACGKCSEIMRAGGQPGCVIRDAGYFLPKYREYVLKN
jgi:2,4-dienoyl-CoA reductase-like NADH-dependent reductase (Old Yellow Enzyme family)